MTSTLGASAPPVLVSELVDPRHLSDYLRQTGLDIDGAAPTYVRYKPGTGAVIAMELTRGDQTHLGYVRRAFDPKRPAQIVAKALAMKPKDTELGASVRLLDDHSVLFLFPTDAKLRQLRWVASAHRIRHLVGETFGEGPYWGEESTVSILRYKPERRLVGKARLVPKRGRSVPERSFVYRLTAEAEATKLFGINEAARGAGIAVPRPIATLEAGRLHLEEALDAIPLIDAVTDGWFEPDALAEIVGQIPSVDAAGLEPTTPADDLARAQRALSAIRSYQPGLGAAISAVGASLVAACPDFGPMVTSHGDLHAFQFMVSRDETVYLVDWERAALGHPGRDLGRLLAHPHALGVRRPELPIASLKALVTEAVDTCRSRTAIADHHLGFYVAVAFVDQALLVCRHLEPDNGARAERLLDLAAQAMNHHASGLGAASHPTDWKQP